MQGEVRAEQEDEVVGLKKVGETDSLNRKDKHNGGGHSFSQPLHHRGLTRTVCDHRWSQQSNDPLLAGGGEQMVELEVDSWSTWQMFPWVR